MFFDSWEGVLRVVIAGTLSYISLIVILRISGKRTLSKMNMFDFVITVALGSTFATIILSKDVALVEGLLALALLVFLQYVVAWLSIHSKAFQKLVKGEPSLLFYRGRFLHDALREERIAVEEIRAAARSNGISDMSQLGAVVLETDGTFSVIPAFDQQDAASLEDVNLQDVTA